MKDLSHKSSINIPHWALGLLLLFFFCAPAYASDAPATPTFRSTSPFGINQTIQHTTVNINGIHQGTIYKPFSSDHPFADLNPGSGSGGGSGNGNDDDDIGIGGWVDTPSEPLPIGDTLPLFLFAAAMIAIIWIRQRRKLQTQSINTSNKNDNSDSMHTTRHISSNRFQKLFLLLAFVCFVGQVSGQATSKVIYFRPSTVALGSNVSWTKMSSSAWFPMLRNNNSIDDFNQKQWHSVNSGDKAYTSNNILYNPNTRSRFLAYTIYNPQTDRFAFYRINDCTDYEDKVCEDNLDHLPEYGSKDFSNPGNAILNCVPNNGWFKTDDTKWNDRMFTLDELGYHNLVCIKEGTWDEYYFAYYVDTKVDLYFVNLHNWNNPTFVRGKDIYSYTETTTKIPNTKLYRTELTAKTDIAYRDYAYIDNQNDGWGADEPDLWKNHKGKNTSDVTTLAIVNTNRLESRYHKATHYSGIKEDDYLSGTNLMFPGANDGDALEKTPIKSWEELNHQQTIKVEGVGNVNYYAFKLTSATTTDDIGGNKTETVSFDAAYTSTVALRAYDNVQGYKFIGWFEEGSNTPVVGAYEDPQQGVRTVVYKYMAPNEPKTLVARYKQVEPFQTKRIRTQIFQDNGEDPIYDNGDWIDNASGGNVTLEFIDANGEKQNQTFSGTWTSLGELPYNTSLTFTATPTAGYTFIGWWNNGPKYQDNPWTPISHLSNESVTARFAKTTEQVISAQTYNTATHKYETEVTEGGQVNITYYSGFEDSGQSTSVDISTIGTYKALYETIVTLEAKPKSGYEFVGWFNDEGEQVDWTKNEGLDIAYYAGAPYTFTARFHKPFVQTFTMQTANANGQYANGTTGGSATIKYNDGSETVTLGGNIATYNIQNMYQGGTVTLTVTPKTGYKFVGWFNAADVMESNLLEYTYISKENRTLYARFAPINNQLTVSIMNYNPEHDRFEEYGYEYNKVTLTQNGNDLEESYSSFTHNFNTEIADITLTATPEDGEYNFVGWYIDNKKLPADTNDIYTLAADNPTILSYKLTGSLAVKAYFAPITSKDDDHWKVRIDHNICGTYTVQYNKDSTSNTYHSVESSLTEDFYIYVPKQAYIRVSSVKPYIGYKALRYKRGGTTKNIGVWHQTSSDNHNIQVEFVREDEQIVYLNLKGHDGQAAWPTPSKDPNEYAYYAYVDNNFFTSAVKLKWIRMEHIGDYCYRCTIPIDKNNKIYYSRVNFVQVCKDKDDKLIDKDTKQPINIQGLVTTNDLDNNTTLSLTYIRDTVNVQKVRSGYQIIPATRNNCYRLNWSWNSSKNGYEDAWTEPPTEMGDFRLVYIEQTVVDKNTIREDYRFEDAGLIKHSPNTEDTISLHIYNKVSGNVNGVNNPEIILQKCTAIVDGKSQWEDLERHMVFGPLRSNNTGVIKMPNRKNSAQIVVDKGIAPIVAAASNEDQACGVWNFVIVQDNAGGAHLDLDEESLSQYEDEYYIRTTNATGQYNNYTHPDNIMSTSEYAKNYSDYSHYFISDVDIYEDGTPTAQAGRHPLVKFAIANKHSVYLNNELMINNDRFTSGICKDEYEDDPFVVNKGGAPNLPADATVRFGWDSKTNRLTRAYIANTTIKNNEYLVVEGDKISPQGDDTYFTDNSNWLYSIDLNVTKDADNDATAKVKAKMNGQYQYFMGAQPGSQNEYETLISGNGAGTYPIRLLYDFKDDRFTTIYRPSNTDISGTVTLETPVMIERKHNEAPTQIKFANNAKFVVNGNFDKPAYAVMTFLESVLADASKTHHEKMFYWISFPFDVCIRDVFGLGDYGKYWIMEEYNGAQRAASGLAQNNWKYITKKSAILEANKGYVLCLNYSQILQDQLFKSYGGSDNTLNSGKLSLYFPSNSVISPEDITGGQERTVELAQYEDANTAWNHHNWHIIGVPSFANPEGIDFQNDAPFVYQYWHPSDGYAAKAYNEITFQAMHAYMVQYHGDITWQNIVNTGNGSVTQKGLAAKTDEQADKKIMLSLELQQAGSTIDKTYVQLRNDKGTKGFDMSLDLTKIINAGANIYSIVDNHEMAGNAIPKEETVLPLGVVITAAGEYTFAMPKGTEGIIVELIDYEQGTSTNLLMSDYTITLNKGTFNQRFALRLVPDKVATSVDNIGTEADGDKVRKLLIDGVLYLQQGNNTYDAQGKHVQ